MGEDLASRAQGTPAMGTEGGSITLFTLWTAGGICGSGVFGVICSSRQVKQLFQAGVGPLWPRVGDPSQRDDRAAEYPVLGEICHLWGRQHSLIPLPPSAGRRRRS